MFQLIDKLAGWWIDWRMSQISKGDPDLENFKKLDIKDIKINQDGFDLFAVSPAIAILAEEAAGMLQANNAKNYVQFDMMPRVDRRMKPIRVTVQWKNGESPAAKAARLEEEVERLRIIERQVRYYLSSDGDTYQAYLKLCEVCGIPPEEPTELDEEMGKLHGEISSLRVEVERLQEAERKGD